MGYQSKNQTFTSINGCDVLLIVVIMNTEMNCRPEIKW